MGNNGLSAWESYRDRELQALTPLLAKHGITLEDEQPHIAGERYLMQAVTTTSGRKLILLGQMNGKRVVIKATTDSEGAKELLHERTCRELLVKIRFAYEVFHTPEEVLFTREEGFTLSVQRFIEQSSTFIGRPLKEQFALALSAFKAQEGAHATTYGHMRRIRGTFGSMSASDYLREFASFRDNVRIHQEVPELVVLLEKAYAVLHEHSETIERYTGFLTHTDFVPHNFRVVGDDIYLLDYSSLRFGNKYEGWARFVNFMALYNPKLEQALTDYVRLNRTPEEEAALHLMRIYRLGEILWYYTRTLSQSTGDLQRLNRARIEFWSKLLTALLSGKRLTNDDIATYTNLRDRLRSEDEKRRQKDLH